MAPRTNSAVFWHYSKGVWEGSNPCSKNLLKLLYNFTGLWQHKIDLKSDFIRAELYRLQSKVTKNFYMKCLRVRDLWTHREGFKKRNEGEKGATPRLLGNQEEGLGGVLDSARRGFEDEGGEGRLGEEKRKENNPWGVQVFNLFTLPFVNDNNELCERKRKLSSLLLLLWYDFSFSCQ